MESQTILIVEDEAIVALDLKLQLKELGYRVLGIAASAEEALEAVAKQPPNLILMDVRLQGTMDGIEAAEAIRLKHGIPLIFLTSHSDNDNDTVQRAARTAPYGYLTKPYQIKELRAGIEVALAKARMERQLREADRWFAHTLQCVADGVIVTDMDAKVRFLNPAAEALTGWTTEAAAGRPIEDVVQMREGTSGNTAPAQAGAAAVVREVLRDGRPVLINHARRLVPRAGTDKVVDETAGPVNDEHGMRLGAVLVLRDASDRVARESMLRASEARFRNAFDHAPLGMALVSLAGDFIQVNDALCRLLGASRADLQRGSHVATTLAADRAYEAQRLHHLADLPDQVVQFEKRYSRQDGGEPFWALVSVSLMRDDDRPTCYLYQVHDLTQQKAAAEHLAALAEERMRREASEMASASKTEFLSRASHELRTPLNAVIGLAHLLQMDQALDDPVKIRTYVDHIHAAGQHLLGLVTDLLDLNRVTQGTLKVETTAVPLTTVVDDALRLLQGQAQTHGVHMATEVPASLVVMGSAQRLRQVLLNIGSNAIKYNRQGGSLGIRAAAASPGWVALVVDDGGIGMTRDQLDRLFQPFDRLGAERTAIPGTGLGLVISRSLVEEMGGTLTVDSTPRRGTTVTIVLNAAP